MRLIASYLTIPLALAASLPLTALAQNNEPAVSPVNVVVNSAVDGDITPDTSLTLREAIALTNGTLSLADLSEAERSQVTPQNNHSLIAFDLPAGEMTVQLTSMLPPLTQAGTVMDGATQAGYGGEGPVVAIAPAPETQILRGLTIAASDVTIRGLSLYGFTTAHDRPTEPTPPADIFITHAYEIDGSRTAFAVHSDGQELPNNILIEQNWLGLTPAGTVPETRSAFGVSVYNASGVTIRENLIGHHSGSGIITGARAENLTVTDNQIIYNGLAGMPDGIRLDGQVDNGLISNNLICGNDGSGIFLFKPQGAVDIIDNAILSNGQRLQRAAIYLMGNDHRVINNQIADQSGPGVVVTAFSQGNATHSRRNIITDNRFSNLDGLSIDLNTRRHRGVQDFQIGDGPNPPRNSVQRRRDTGNSAINAPEFASPEFYLLDGRVVLQGQADPGSTVQLYQTVGRTGDYGPLTEPLVTVVVDEFGSFEYATSELQSGDVVSAIATDPRYGTSEPALNAVVFSLGEQSDLPERTAPVADPAACLASPDFSDS